MKQSTVAVHVHWGGGLQYDTTRQRMGLVADMQGAVDVDSGDMGSAWVCHMYTTINWMGGTYTTINRWAYTTSTMGSDQ